MRRQVDYHERQRFIGGPVLRDDAGKSGWGDDFGGREGYGASPERPEGYGAYERPGTEWLEDEEARAGHERPNAGGGEYGREFSRREGWGRGGREYGRDFGGWELHHHDYSGRVFYPPTAEYMERSGGGMGGRKASGAFTRGGFLEESRDEVSLEHEPVRGQRGMGPRGYIRPDDRILDDVVNALTDSDDVDATDIIVSVRNGEVTLSGDVDDREQRWAAEDLVESVHGVKAVLNELGVRNMRPPSDEPLRRESWNIPAREQRESPWGARGTRNVPFRGGSASRTRY
ncbi:MAG: BON domain-containing protein [Myxococcota bacterium]